MAFNFYLWLCHLRKKRSPTPSFQTSFRKGSLFEESQYNRSPHSTQLATVQPFSASGGTTPPSGALEAHLLTFLQPVHHTAPEKFKETWPHIATPRCLAATVRIIACSVLVQWNLWRILHIKRLLRLPFDKLQSPWTIIQFARQAILLPTTDRIDQMLLYNSSLLKLANSSEKRLGKAGLRPKSLLGLLPFCFHTPLWHGKDILSITGCSLA